MPPNWDEHYAALPEIDLTPVALLVQVAEQLAPGDALDLACGPGRHALHLARLGWRVTAVDSSAVAIRLLRERAAGLPIDARQADLERGEFSIERGAYDLICDFFYLQRSLFPQIREGLRPGGVFAGQIHIAGSFSVQPGELRNLFKDWNILYYSETPEKGERRPSARIVAQASWPVQPSEARPRWSA